jgi:hypothetical protein
MGVGYDENAGRLWRRHDGWFLESIKRMKVERGRREGTADR